MSEYIILEAGTREDIVIKVNERIGAGWEPIGGVAVRPLCHGSDRVIYAQAMIKRA